jgi:hypothetical protein
MTSKAERTSPSDDWARFKTFGMSKKERIYELLIDGWRVMASLTREKTTYDVWGAWYNWMATLVMYPRVPSEPIEPCEMRCSVSHNYKPMKRCCRWYPQLSFLSDRSMSRTVPLGKTTSRPSEAGKCEEEDSRNVDEKGWAGVADDLTEDIVMPGAVAQDSHTPSVGGDISTDGTGAFGSEINRKIEAMRRHVVHEMLNDAARFTHKNT